MVPEFADDIAPFAGANQFAVGKHDRVEWALDFLLPELDEVKEFWVVRCQIVLLPHVGVDDPLVVGYPVEDLGGC